MAGYNLEILRKINKKTKLPVIALGGAGSKIIL